MEAPYLLLLHAGGSPPKTADLSAKSGTSTVPAVATGSPAAPGGAGVSSPPTQRLCSTAPMACAFLSTASALEAQAMRLKASESRHGWNDFCTFLC